MLREQELYPRFTATDCMYLRLEIVVLKTKDGVFANTSVEFHAEDINPA